VPIERKYRGGGAFGGDSTKSAWMEPAHEKGTLRGGGQVSEPPLTLNPVTRNLGRATIHLG